MDRYRYVTVERQGDVYCVRLRRARLDEGEIYQLADELIDLCLVQGCRKLALSLGPEPPDCMYSVFLAKLITVQRTLHEHRGEMVLCEVGPAVRTIFEACRLDRQFRFAPDFATAVARWDEEPPNPQI
jgi:anti-anti-sigma factor